LSNRQKDEDGKKKNNPGHRSNSFCTRRGHKGLQSSFRLTVRSFRVTYERGLQEITAGAERSLSTASASRTVPGFALPRHRKTILVSSTENLHPVRFYSLGVRLTSYAYSRKQTWN